MKLIVGLGNPGKDYINTRHNIGFMILDNYLGFTEWKEKFNAYYYEKNIANEKIIFIKPLTYMNNSGLAVKKFVDYYKIDFQDILVIQDDLDLSFGKYRLKINSSSGGHNGIKSIIECLNSKEFARLKIGISSIKDMDTKDYVLGKFNSQELELLNSLYPTFNNILTDFATKPLPVLMNNYNHK